MRENISHSQGKRKDLRSCYRKIELLQYARQPRSLSLDVFHYLCAVDINAICEQKVDTGKKGCIIFPVALEGAPSKKRERLIKQDTSGHYEVRAD